MPSTICAFHLGLGLDEFIATIDSDRAFGDTSPMDRPSTLHKMLTLFKIG